MIFAGSTRGSGGQSRWLLCHSTDKLQYFHILPANNQQGHFLSVATLIPSLLHVHNIDNREEWNVVVVNQQNCLTLQINTYASLFTKKIIQSNWSHVKRYFKPEKFLEEIYMTHRDPPRLNWYTNLYEDKLLFMNICTLSIFCFMSTICSWFVFIFSTRLMGIFYLYADNLSEFLYRHAVQTHSMLIQWLKNTVGDVILFISNI